MLSLSVSCETPISGPPFFTASRDHRPYDRPTVFYRMASATVKRTKNQAKNANSHRNVAFIFVIDVTASDGAE
jgi:hypothetical protein